MPAQTGLLKRLIIRTLILVNLFLKRNITRDIKISLVQQKKRKKSRDTAVSIIKRVDAKKIKNDTGNQKKPVDLAFANGDPISKDQIAHRLRRERGRNGIPSNNRRAILMRFRNNVIVLFPFAPMDDLGPLSHQMMQRANDVLVKLEAQTVLMNDG